MATTYSSRFYRSSGAVIVGRGMSHSNTGGALTAALSETIATTVTDGLDEHFLMPAPAGGNRILQGFWLSAGDMDTGGPTLDADIVFRTVLNGVTTDTIVYDSSVAGLFSAAIAMKWVDGAQLLLANSDTGIGHFVFKVGVAATTPAAANLTFIPVVT
jgi:hypothetical protein